MDHPSRLARARSSGSPEVLEPFDACEGANPMSAAQQALYARIERYSFDAPDVPMPYSRRLAEREGWSDAYTSAVIAEYRRFAFLAMSSGHVATPSKAVDAAWHLHLEYTREYWDVFCGQVLGAPLHHTPGNGAPDEEAAYAALYAQTLDSYRHLFGAAPPESVWPRPFDTSCDVAAAMPAVHAPASQNFRRLIAVGLESLRHIMRSSRAAVTAWPACLTATIATCAYAGELDAYNVLDYAGPRFLHFYLMLCVGVLLLIFFVHRIEYRRRVWGLCRDAGGARELEPYEAGLIVGGVTRMVHVATLGLLHARAIRISRGKRGQPQVIAGEPAEAGAFGDACNWLRVHLNSQAAYSAFSARLALRAPEVAVALAAQGWLWPRGGMRTLRVVARALALFAIGLGCAKIGVGMSRERPVGALVFGVIVFAIVWLILMARLPGLGRAGPTLAARDALDARRARTGRGGTAPDMLLWLTAILGTSVLAGTAWASYASVLTASRMTAGGVGTDGSSGGCSSSSCNSSSCSSSSCSSSSCGGCSSS